MKPSRTPAPAWGYGRLAVDAVLGLAGVVEAMHATISRAPAPFGDAPQKLTRGLTGRVYRQIRTVAELTGGGLDLLRAGLEGELPSAGKSSPEHEAVVAVINGVVGDYLEDTANPLAIRMSFRQHGRMLDMTHPTLGDALERPTGKIAIMVGGLCMNDRMWNYKGHDHGAALAADRGFSPVYLRYNSGRHVSTNGREFGRLLEALLLRWPVPVTEVVIVAHSLGGLVTRSALSYADEDKLTWPARIRKIFYLGTPHHGAPLERGGNQLQWLAGVSPYTAPLARLGTLRSAAITDLRHGYLRDSDWNAVDRFAPVAPPESTLPLPSGIAHFALAVTLGSEAGALADRLLGDGMVPLESALGRHATPARTLAFADERQWVGYGLGHIDLVCRPEVYAALLRFVDA